MRNIRAYRCTREGHLSSTQPSAACFVLNASYTRHTLRVFQRGQGRDSVVSPIPSGDAAQLLVRETPSSATSTSRADNPWPAIALGEALGLRDMRITPLSIVGLAPDGTPQKLPLRLAGKIRRIMEHHGQLRRFRL